MNKQTAIELLGGTAKLAASAMGYKSSHAVYMWPDVLPISVEQRVMGVHQSLKTKSTKSAKKETKK